MKNHAQILEEFLLETQEIFDQLDIDLVRMEQEPRNDKLLASIFRAMHTIKGSSGFFAFRRLEKVAHAAESLLTKLREGALHATPDLTDTLLATLDALRLIVGGIAEQHLEPVGDDATLLTQLAALTEGSSFAKTLPNDVARPGVLGDSAYPTPAGFSQATFNDTGTRVDVDLELLDAAKQADLMAPVKISVDLLDELMDLVSEMVLARNRLLSFASSSADANFSSTVRTIDLITLELQERMMKTRMQPISTVWSKFPRLVRDLARECGKNVQLIEIGAHTELDRALLEAIRDPLIHIIRNSVDHGIELPQQRVAAGKPETGTITLCSKHENGMVIIEIGDDGGGVDLGLVAATALQKGLVSQERISRMTDREIINFIYLPGFSTKPFITEVSGRGVGMDVVRTKVQQIGGAVEVVSSSKGTELRLRIPLTLAIMPALFVQCATQRFAIPQNNLLEMIKFAPSDSGLEDFYGVPVYRLRNRLIPIVDLGHELGFDSLKKESDENIHIVVVQANGLVFGLMVDKVLFLQEVVVKSTGPLLKNISIYSGATILGDGQVAMIFDVGGIALRSGLVSKLTDQDLQSELPGAVTRVAATQSMLLFDLAHMPRLAIALDYVDRLEIFPIHKVEQQGQHDVIIYGENIMKLIWLSDYIESPSASKSCSSENINVIVHYHQGQPIGLVVQHIHDIIEIAAEIVLIMPSQAGIVGSAIYADQVVSILNVEEILQLSKINSYDLHKKNEDTILHSHFTPEGVLT